MLFFEFLSVPAPGFQVGSLRLGSFVGHVHSRRTAPKFRGATGIFKRIVLDLFVSGIHDAFMVPTESVRN